MGILSLPWDVQSIICSTLHIRDVARLRQTCSALSAAISADKQLWAHIFAKHVKAQSLRVPFNLHGIEHVKARDIESWVKHAVLLDRRYKTPQIQLSTRKVNIREGLHVTWLKLILGRWCLVAAADDDVSELSLWDMFSTGQIRCAAKVFLDAPVMDGQIDCSTGTTCAFTVGTTLPYILVIGMYQFQHSAGFRELARMTGAAHVIFFRGNLVGFAARDGDDTYPYIWNWKTGEMHRLHIPHDSSSDICPLPLEHCTAISVKDGFLVTLHTTVAHIFNATVDADNVHCPSYLGTLHFESPAAHGQFLDTDSVSSGTDIHGEPTVIRILYRTFEYSVIEQAIIELSRGEDGYSMKDHPLNQPPNVPYFRVPYLVHVGTSGRTVFCATSLDRRRWWNPSLHFASLSNPDVSGSAGPLQMDGGYIPFSRKGLPLSHLFSAVDFDDGAGLLLVGTTLGDVCVGSVLSESAIARRSLRTELSDDAGAILSSESKGDWDVPTPLVLPPFYDIRKKYRIHDKLPQEVIMRVIPKWREPSADILSMQGWSNDWTIFECIWDWITPLSRWGPLDRGFMNETIENAVRNRLQALGDIVPVLFRLENHDEVVFRIGQRMFYSRQWVPGEPEDDFELHPKGILGVLPLTFDRFMNAPTEILRLLSDRSITINLEARHCPSTLLWRMDVADMAYTVIAHVDQRRCDVNMMVEWTNAEWDEHAFTALDREYSEEEKEFRERDSVTRKFLPIG